MDFPTGAGGVVAVTGSAGFIGRRLTDRLRSGGHEVVEWSRDCVDLTNGEALAAAMARDRPSVIYHLAAVGAGPGQGNDQRAAIDNVVMAENLVAAAPPKTTLVVAGTMAEYGTGGVLDEDMPCHPRTAYGTGKHAAVRHALTHGPPRGLLVRVGRLFGVYGPGEAPQRLFPSLLHDLSASQPVSLSDGKQQRDFVHVDDAVASLVQIAALPGSDPVVINVGTGQGILVGDVCRWIAKAIGVSTALLQFGSRQRSSGDADQLVANVTRLRQLTGLVPPQRLEPVLDLGLFTSGARIDRP
ncbi:MAG: NAD-dependent epimerase/dehydratase family protein [Acidimicrobiia bacterium]|nr:NAD-dependent epimerase/dehydratase family protein [Acidimicrobiia bacterium]